MTDEADPAAVPSVDELVGELQARVEQRRAEGHYPPDLAESMRSHFERVLHHRPQTDLEVLRQQLEKLDSVGSFDPARISLESGAPGGQWLHATVARLVHRQTQGVLEQVQQFGDAVREVLRTVLAALEEPHGHVHEDLLGQVDALLERLARLERRGDGGLERPPTP